MKDFFENHIKDIEKQLKDQYTARSQAGPGTIGDYNNRISELEKQWKEVRAKLDDLDQKEVNPGQKQLYIFIVTSTKNVIAANLGEQLYNILPQDAYDNDCRYWKPFTKEPALTIDMLINGFKNEIGFEFEYIYLDHDIDLETYELIEAHKDSSIAIIDLLSLDKDHESFAIRFDSNSLLYVLTPICSRIDNQLKDYMELRRSKVFQNLEGRLRSPEQWAPVRFDPNVSDQIDFSSLLKNIFAPIKKLRNYLATPESDATNLRRVQLLNPGM